MINSFYVFKQKAFYLAFICIISAQNVFSSQNSFIDHYFQSGLEKKGSWDMRQPGRVLTTEDIAVILDNLDYNKTKVYRGESQIPEHRDRGLQTVTLLCAYLVDSENKRDRYPQMIFGAHPERAAE